MKFSQLPRFAQGVIVLDFLLVMGLTSCATVAAVAPAVCKVVNVLNDACMVLTFTAADGTPHTVTCSAKELNDWGANVEAKHHAGVQWTP
jgi:hypothetical protein